MQAKVFVLLCAILPARAQVINIDSFNDGDFTQANTTVESTYTGNSMIGGERRVKMSSPAATASVSGGVLTFSDPSTHLGVTLNASYGSSDPANQAKHLHLDAAAYPGLFLNISAASQPTHITVAVFSLDNGAQQSANATFHITGPGQYVGTYTGAANVNNLSGLGLTLNAFGSEPPGTFVLDSFGFTTAVPEPMTSTVTCGLLLAGLAIVRKYKKHKRKKPPTMITASTSSFRKR